METNAAPFKIGDVVTVTENIPCCVFKAGQKVSVTNVAWVTCNDGQDRWVVWAQAVWTKAEWRSNVGTPSKDTIPARALTK
jgi:hypothetical protein